MRPSTLGPGSALLIALLLGAAPSLAMAQRTGQQQWEQRQEGQPSDSHEQRRRDSIRRRIEDANRNYEAARAEAQEIAELNTLISLSRRVGFLQVRKVAQLCSCEILALQLAIGSQQVSFGVDSARIHDGTSELDLTERLISFLTHEIATSDEERNSKGVDPRHARFMSELHASMSGALAQTRKSGVLFNGMLVRTDAAGLERVRESMQSQILAVEFAPRRIVMMAVPLEPYKEQ